MAGWPPGSLGVERESERAWVFRSPLAEAPLLLAAKSPPKWLPQKTQAGPGVWPAETTAPAGGTHHVGQAAELFQPQEHPLDGLLHLLRLEDSIPEVSTWFPGRQVLHF